MNNGPYFNTYLYTTISLHPSQMDNDIYKHLKTNLQTKLQNKCYMHYGYISKIYKIEERHGGEIIAEDPTASATFKLKFSCKLCRPLKGTTIVCEVVSINKTIIGLRNGPIHMIITDGNINLDNFIYDEKQNVWLAYAQNGKGITIVNGTYVKAKVTDIKIEDKSDRILALGTLEEIASKRESDDVIMARELDDDQFVKYDDYINKEKEKPILVDEQNTPTDNDSSEFENLESDNDI
jgi:DNA-directed RNA polymerase subunit E'/Rpb7